MAQGRQAGRQVAQGSSVWLSSEVVLGVGRKAQEMGGSSSKFLWASPRRPLFLRGTDSIYD